MTGETRPLAIPESTDVRCHLGRVLGAYGHLSPGLLVKISHAPRGPWAAIRNQAAHGTALGARIPDSVTVALFRYQMVAIDVWIEPDYIEEDAPLHPVEERTRP